LRAGAGLGDRFLGHVERCGAVLHLVDGTLEDVATAYRTIRNELALYGRGLVDKPEVVALNKCDALDAETIAARRKALSKAAGKEAFAISGVAGQGITEVLRALLTRIKKQRAAEAAASAAQG
jgi:GTP-binding protein